MMPLYKQEMYTLKFNSTRNFNTVRYHFLCSFGLYLLVLVPPAFVWNCRRKPFTQPFSHYRDTAAYPPHHRLLSVTLPHFTTRQRPHWPLVRSQYRQRGIYTARKLAIMWHLNWPHYLRFDSKVGGQSIKIVGVKTEKFFGAMLIYDAISIFPDPPLFTPGRSPCVCLTSLVWAVDSTRHWSYKWFVPQSTSVAALRSRLYSGAVGRDGWRRPFQGHCQ